MTEAFVEPLAPDGFKIDGSVLKWVQTSPLEPSPNAPADIDPVAQAALSRLTNASPDIQEAFILEYAASLEQTGEVPQGEESIDTALGRMRQPIEWLVSVIGPGYIAAVGPKWATTPLFDMDALLEALTRFDNRHFSHLGLVEAAVSGVTAGLNVPVASQTPEPRRPKRKKR
ncbi:MAG TPA: hypothetical protein VLG37_00285 [Candidatus Saccharimonadales bacterium]|nr:hypothetical protein [Candidatus Saccharimonadales bacterium]